MQGSDEYIRFELLGESFTIKSDVSEKYFLSLVKKLEEKINEMKVKFPNLSNVKIALFAALDFADEMSQLGNNTLDKDAIKALSDLSDSLASAIQED